jgi:hypothetical protein
VTFGLVTFLDVDARDGDYFHAKTPRLRHRYPPKIAAAIDSTTEAPTYIVSPGFKNFRAGLLAQ